MSTIPLFVAPPGGLELLVILLVLALLFGPSKLTSLAHAAGRSTGEFRKGREEIEREIRTTAGFDTTTASDAEDASDPLTGRETV
ncbi:twin-arginine translocase TatA/TatE family subunit [Halomarina litorea]|uniref:twin-arginine translocase TatA/TatE family subunit n=1 Tax=Halomarina litorea TaxID=2961595 RepID=UPI0020C1DB27|nr:twin-arginine translocase TatA/TatE family subunit [Halomarina sp. BCD28]